MRPDIIGVFIPIVAIVMGIGIGMLSIWTEHKRKAQLLEQFHKERITAMEKGISLPELERGLVVDESAPPTAAKAFRNGLMMLLIGTVLFFALDELIGSKVSLFGLIPAAVGVANLVYGVLLLKKEQAEKAGQL